MVSQNEASHYKMPKVPLISHIPLIYTDLWKHKVHTSHWFWHLLSKCYLLTAKWTFEDLKDIIASKWLGVKQDSNCLIPGILVYARRKTAKSKLKGFIKIHRFMEKLIGSESNWKILVELWGRVCLCLQGLFIWNLSHIRRIHRSFNLFQVYRGWQRAS